MLNVISWLLAFCIISTGIRFLFYFDSLFFHWRRYRQLEEITADDLKALPAIPFVKVQITTRGAPGSTHVICRGIRNVVALVAEDPELYSPRLSVEVITESETQKNRLAQEFCQAPADVKVLVLPPAYETPNRTKLKARGLHYMVEQRRRGFNRKPGWTFIVHFDEESVMEPAELRKLLHYLATTGKKISEGPILYPFEYRDASMICRAMEANRPIGCFECREVMEQGLPLHLHGSNLVVDEELENELGWDIGTLDGQPFIAEDYVFGVLAYLKEGSQAFGWHGAVMLEQPPFSFRSAFRQRYRWVFGVLQGIEMLQRMPEFHRLSPRERLGLIWNTRYRVLTFALGCVVGASSVLYLVYQAWRVLLGSSFSPIPVPIMICLVLTGFLWLNSTLIGAWFNVSAIPQLSPTERLIEIANAFLLTPIAGVLESGAAFFALVQWMLGKRTVSWQPTPKSKGADNVVNSERERLAVSRGKARDRDQSSDVA